jgi:glyceraldehyde-3-phosphate dehydrogenase (NADP+)
MQLREPRKLVHPPCAAPVAAAACTREEVDAVFKAAKSAQHAWAKTPLWKRAEYLHKVAAIMRENAQPMADCLVKEIAKPAKDSVTEVVRSADLIDYTAEEGLRALGEGQMLTSDSFPGQKRNKLCLVSKVGDPPKWAAAWFLWDFWCLHQ